MAAPLTNIDKSVIPGLGLASAGPAAAKSTAEERGAVDRKQLHEAQTRFLSRDDREKRALEKTSEVSSTFFKKTTQFAAVVSLGVAGLAYLFAGAGILFAIPCISALLFGGISLNIKPSVISDRTVRKQSLEESVDYIQETLEPCKGQDAKIVRLRSEPAKVLDRLRRLDTNINKLSSRDRERLVDYASRLASVVEVLKAEEVAEEEEQQASFNQAVLENITQVLTRIQGDHERQQERIT